MKRIINGMTFDTETAAEIWSEHVFWDGPDGPEVTPSEWSLHQTRHGAFFKVIYHRDRDGENTSILPLTDDQAQKLLEEHANHLVEQFFGPMPEYGASERRLTVRIPARLAHRVETAAASQGVTVNHYIMRSLERTLSFGPVSAR